MEVHRPSPHLQISDINHLDQLTRSTLFQNHRTPLDSTSHQPARNSTLASHHRHHAPPPLYQHPAPYLQRAKQILAPLQFTDVPACHSVPTLPYPQTNTTLRHEG
ncbi:hypothetical protein M407DRAFT_153786 [Tulasnella calospora MUT 4182]|uniref:Uncharacterized protein n=1 Tax=Tulasnella calospora MUT 4182 TaxID=1051891 RepID=A0A0C3L9A3_9AGAM|nr:hypothetical protein M407DRAFT_153786 [Tulasnella calospora MUT 4182]